MKFKNYRNPYTNDNRIYTNKDLYNMSFGEFIKRKNEVLGQYRVLGVPTEKELQGSENVVYVEAYTREDGTEVKAHYRSKPGGSSINKQNNNIAKTDNEQKTNETNEPTKIPENNVQNQELETTENGQERTPEQTEEKDKRLYPDEIAGVKREKEMSFEEVVNKGVNPSYDKTAEENIYDGNCNSCVAAYVYCRRGFSVNAASTLDNAKAEELSHNGLDLWVDPDTNKICEWTEIDTNKETVYNQINNNMKPGEIYEIAEYPQFKTGDLNSVSGHVVIAEKGNDNQLKIYDPQKREIYEDSEKVKMYLRSWTDAPEASKDVKPKVIRVDNKCINPYYEDVLIQ